MTRANGHDRLDGIETFRHVRIPCMATRRDVYNESFADGNRRPWARSESRDRRAHRRPRFEGGDRRRADQSLSSGTERSNYGAV